MWRKDFEDCFRDEDAFDLQSVECPPVDDGEAEVVEAICLAATPGPLVTDDLSDGDGALVATLPDGRSIVSVIPPPGSPEDVRAMVAANAHLICESRCLLLRLLRDRQRWKRREQCLAEEIRELRAQLEEADEAIEPSGLLVSAYAPARPR